MSNNLVSQALPIPARQMEHVSIQSNSTSQLLPTKRKAGAEPLSSNSLTQQSSVSNKRFAQMEPRADSPRSSQPSDANKRRTQFHTMPSTQGSLNLPNKKMMRNESMSSKSGSPNTAKAVKIQNESFEGVRSKMRETLASALSVGTENQEKAPNDDKNSLCENFQSAGVTAANENIRNTDQIGNTGQEPQYNYVIPDADGAFSDTFFAKDELLQGNGLSWAWNMDIDESKDVQFAESGQCAERPNSEHIDLSGNRIEQVVSVNSPGELASRIEAELFKLFGGVNKKYKEKGRSLMFNLKDRNNPELREKVLSGKISPERLCSMTPEELASKELSEWRMAKAEELDKMIVLPDSDVDVRRLVKKTHKGEYQVEVEQDDGVSVEVSVGSTSFTQLKPKKKKEKETTEGEKGSSESQDSPSGLTIPADGTDFMQELIADEFKDEGFLPPIVSLDEFMDSLDSEPPFENLPVDAKNTKPTETGGETSSEKVLSPVGAKAGKSEQLKVKTTEPLATAKTRETSVERKFVPAASVVTGEHLWEGQLQLTISSSVSVIGLFRSGEKTSTKEWPSSMEIKGRVRLDAFEKFLRELPMSRSRAVMVLHFVLKDPSSEIHHASLSEAVDSYAAEERLGFGEPIPGVELYFCPPQKRIIEMLCTHLPKVKIDILKSTDNGLIGVVVWRRIHLSAAISPNSSSHHKHHRTHNINSNMNSNLTLKSSPFDHHHVNNGGGGGDDDDDDDDIPPGFGPGAAARDEDDLPEFNFSGNSTSSGQKLPAQMGLKSRMTETTPGRPVEQMRQLIYKYGHQTGNLKGNDKPWNQDADDDDDMPEWQPPLPANPHSHHHRPVVAQQPLGQNVDQIRPIIAQIPSPVMTMQQPVNAFQHGGRWVQPPGHDGFRPNSPVPGRRYGGQWRHDAPRSRGF